MCGSVADIHLATAEDRWGKQFTKKEKLKQQNIMVGRHYWPYWLAVRNNSSKT